MFSYIFWINPSAYTVDVAFLVMFSLKCFYSPQRSCEGYVFTRVCLSTGGEYLGRYPPGVRYTPLNQVHPPDQVHPADQVHPPGTRYTPPGTRCSPLGPGTPLRETATAFYWNAFLLVSSFTLPILGKCTSLDVF